MQSFYFSHVHCESPAVSHVCQNSFISNQFVCTTIFKELRWLFSPLFVWPLSPQIYAQKESQRSGYIELALQAFDQTAAKSSATWPAHSCIEIYDPSTTRNDNINQKDRQIPPMCWIWFCSLTVWLCSKIYFMPARPWSHPAVTCILVIRSHPERIDDTLRSNRSGPIQMCSGQQVDTFL